MIYVFYRIIVTQVAAFKELFFDMISTFPQLAFYSCCLWCNFIWAHLQSWKLEDFRKFDWRVPSKVWNIFALLTHEATLCKNLNTKSLELLWTIQSIYKEFSNLWQSCTPSCIHRKCSQSHFCYFKLPPSTFWSNNHWTLNKYCYLRVWNCISRNVWAHSRKACHLCTWQNVPCIFFE